MARHRRRIRKEACLLIGRFVIKKGEVRADDEVRVARITAVVIGVLAIGGGILGWRSESLHADGESRS